MDNFEYKIQYDRAKDEYYIKEKIDNQTYYIAFQCGTNSKEDVLAFNIYICVYSKRKHEINYENHVTSTGKSPLTTYVFMRNAILKLEEYVTNKELPYCKKIIFYCSWLDKRRRDVYYKFLSKYGYEYKTYFEKKFIAKEILKGDD